MSRIAIPTLIPPPPLSAPGTQTVSDGKRARLPLRFTEKAKVSRDQQPEDGTRIHHSFIFFALSLFSSLPTPVSWVSIGQYKMKPREPIYLIRIWFKLVSLSLHRPGITRTLNACMAPLTHQEQNPTSQEICPKRKSVQRIVRRGVQGRTKKRQTKTEVADR